MTGVCTAPSRVRANESRAVSSRVGNCQATTLPARTPIPYSPAATRSARSRSPPKVRTRSSWSSTGRSGVRAARASSSPQMVREAPSARAVAVTSFTAVTGVPPN